MITVLDKLRLLGNLCSRNPDELTVRVKNRLDVYLDKFRDRAPNASAMDFVSAVSDLGQLLGVPLASFEREDGFLRIENETSGALDRLASCGPFDPKHNADRQLARTCYLLVRALKPPVVVETGVCYGVNSAYILQAMDANSSGSLHSVDLPPLGDPSGQFVGAAIPADLKRRWSLHRGTSRRVLPTLLSTLGKIGMFVHDSLHTYSTMRWEFNAVRPYFTHRGLLVADDVEGNMAFIRFVRQSDPIFSAVVKAERKKGLFGVCLIG